MEESFKPPPPRTREELAKMDKAAQDAVKKADDEAIIAWEKALAAMKHAEKTAQEAGISTAQGSSSEEEGEKKKEEEKKKGSKKQEYVLLPELPSGRALVKTVAKDMVAKVTTIMQQADLDKNMPERMVVAWHQISRAIQAGGLSEAEVKAAIAGLSDDVAVKWCIRDGDDLKEWQKRLSKAYLQKGQASSLRGRLYEAKRREVEKVREYLLRLAPLARAILFMKLMDTLDVLAALWRTEALGLDYCKRNATYFERIRARIEQENLTFDDLLEAVEAFANMEDLPKIAAPTAVQRTEEEQRKEQRAKRQAECKKGRHKGHSAAECWTLHPELNPFRGRRNNNNTANEAAGSECCVVGSDVFVVEARINGIAVRLGLDSMAALNLIRWDTIPAGMVIAAGGPVLHGVGQAAAKGMIKVDVTLDALTFAEVEFAVVDELPVPALLGKPTLTAMGTRMDLIGNVAEIRAGDRTVAVRAIALPMTVLSSRPQAQAYWSWLNKRMADAPKRLQVLFQDVMERANNVMLEKFLACFADWALRERQASGKDDATVHPAPYRAELKRPEAATTGLVVCPTTVAASDILANAGDEDELLAEADDKRDFLPPVMLFEEEDEIVENELNRIVAEAELSAEGKKELRRVLDENRAAFGMQLRKVNFDQEPVHVPLNGVPEHQPRRVIRDVRVRDAQIMWEGAMKERGVVGEYTGKNPETLRPINIHHVIKNMKLRFTADARTRNKVTDSDSFPVPSPMEALERFRRNQMFSTFDEADSFFQYPVDEESRVPFYSASGGILEFYVLIQGGKNSPAALHRKKTAQYAEFSQDEMAFMFDDSLLGTPGTEQDHLLLIEQFLKNCVAHGTILKATKAKLCRSEVKHQGFIIGHGYYYKDPEAVQPLVDMRLPTTASELKSQMSMLGRYRQFVPEYAQLAEPLEAIMHDRWQAGTFTAKHVERLVEMRRLIAQETMLIMPDWNRPFHWRIDAQPTYGWASVVGQEDEEGKFWPIRFMSKKASEADTKRWPTEMEAMAWFHCLADKGRVYSQYSKNIIHGDPKSLRWLADSIETGRANRQMQRVALALQSLDIEFKYHPREEMVDVDVLSRFAGERSSSREELQRFLATDKDVIENTLIVAVSMEVREKIPARMMRGEYAIAVPAGVGPDSPPGVPIDIQAEQGADPICRFIMMIKGGEFRDEAEQNAFIASMPAKAAKALKHHMEVAKSREFANFEIRRGKLFLVDENRLKMPRLRLVVPLRLRVRVLTANHDAPAAGHVGFDKTYEAVTRLYFWFGMYADTKAWVKSCPGCAKGKRRTIAGHGTAQHQGLMPMKFRPFERVVFDLIGPLPESRDGMKHILISVDAHSSETKLDALKTRNSEDIANIMLKRVVLAEGCPKSWQSDNAPELVKAAMAKLSDIGGIDPKSCTAYEAHVEGRVERRNWLVEMMLREMCKDDLQGWPEMLPWVEFAINSSPYSVTGMTPYFHKTGYDPISPMNAWREIGEESGEPVATWHKRMMKAVQFAELAHADAAKERKEQYDKNKRPHGIEAGNSVYMWIARDNKLQQSAVGPMTVARFLDPQTKRTAVVHPPNQPNQTVVVHVDRLIKAQERPAHLMQIPSDLRDWIEGQRVNGPAQPSEEEMNGPPQVTHKQRAAKDKEEEVWDIDRIVDRVDRKDGGRKYRVRYTGYDDPEDDRWYNEEQLREMGRDTVKMLEEFDAERDKEEMQKRIAPRPAEEGVRRSGRRKRVTFKGG